jgi:hypothetical protein
MVAVASLIFLPLVEGLYARLMHRVWRQRSRTVILVYDTIENALRIQQLADRGSEAIVHQISL